MLVPRGMANLIVTVCLGEVWKNLLFTTILKIWVDKIFQLILGRTGFWSGRVYDFILTDHSGELVENNSMLPKKWILVVGRDSYIEIYT